MGKDARNALKYADILDIITNRDRKTNQDDLTKMTELARFANL